MGTNKRLQTSRSIRRSFRSNILTRYEESAMNSSRLPGVFVILLLIGLAGCGGSSPPPASHGGPVKDYVSLVDHLRAASATVVPSGTVTQPFFAVTGQVISVNGEQVQVYEYKNDDDASAEASRISPDGGTVGKAMVDWNAPPHFYKEGRLLVLYVGTNTSVIHLLETTLGPQFAGR
jgi:hypothetical protein